MVLFLGGKSTGKSSLVNYLLGIDETPWEIKVGTGSRARRERANQSGKHIIVLTNESFCA